MSTESHATTSRNAAAEMTPQQFAQLGHQLVDQIAGFLGSLPQRKVTTDRTPGEIRKLLPAGSLPQSGSPAGPLLDEAVSLVVENSLFNGHPRFWGYITSSATPIGALGDFLGAAVNPNVGAWVLSPMASEIESQTIRWIADLVRYPSSCGGVLVSGGNMANFVGFLAARKAKATWDIREQGLQGGPGKMLVYAAQSTHTWIHKAADLFGLGTAAIRWIPVTNRHQMDTIALSAQIESDKAAGMNPFMVVGTVGTVETGVVDPLGEIAAIAKKNDLWFHIDGAYGAPVGVLPEAPAEFNNIALADSIAVDPHKWLYAPLEAGCTLVKNPDHLADAFSFRPKYYGLEGHGDDESFNYFELGMQNSRGFRALKVWLALRQCGRDGYAQMIRDDISLARQMFEKVSATPELQPFTNYLSIATFRYLPTDLKGNHSEAVAKYLDELNEALCHRLQKEGELFVSNAIVEGKYLLRACIVNFRTTSADVAAVPEIVVRVGRLVDKELRPSSLK